MRAYRIAWFLAVVLCFAGCGGLLIWQHVFLYYPTPENESAFLKSYNPEKVIERFREPESWTGSNHKSAGAGKTSVERKAGFEYCIVIRGENSTPLLDALRDDAVRQLSQRGARLLSQSGSERYGFRFDYKVNKSAGTLTIFPISLTPPSRIGRRMPLPAGLEDVTVKIEQTEKWFPKGA